ncbi:MAG TPA: hypothetical protein VKY82_02115 [Flavobacterium sp.]|nr:hypothetical protein [Flavobacterium sp.]
MATPWEKITQCNALGKDNPMATPWEKITNGNTLGKKIEHYVREQHYHLSDRRRQNQNRNKA